MLVPIHKEVHWTALLLDISKRRLVYFDSLGGEDTTTVGLVVQWLQSVAKVRASARLQCVVE